ncbi:MAG: lytic transglycosylase domain-containing protein [Candidatus Aminicenantes bacterium]|nr:lytic transglycosylase domain-containing protein [Candidatus Aminicenantes bacterium]
MTSFAKRIAAGLTAAGFLLLLLPAAGNSAGFWSRMKDKYDPFVKAIADEYGLDADFVHAVIKAESAYNRHAISRAGAQGLMQLMPATAVAYGVKDVFDPEDNIRGGVKFLKVLLKLYDGNIKKTLAAYNAGQEAVKKYGGIPPYAETRTYISRVIATYRAPAPGRRTKIFEFRDASGKTVLTNDPILAAQRGVSGTT